MIGGAELQRTRELGIRSALGSSPADILGLVSRNGIGLIAASLLFGLAGATILSRVLGTMLYGVSAFDPRAWLITAAVLVGAGLLATLIPALRAARIDPIRATRVE